MARPLAPRGQARSRVIAAALTLFAEQGVSGTSLQMIAQRLGVTKAAVYHQFRAKEDIVLAVVDDTLVDMRALVARAEEVGATQGPDGGDDAAAHALLEGLVELTFQHRHALTALGRDPEMARIVEEHPEFREVIDRAHRLMLGPGADLRRRVRVSMLGIGLSHVTVDPRLDDVADADLKAELARLARELLGD